MLHIKFDCGKFPLSSPNLNEGLVEEGTQTITGALKR